MINNSYGSLRRSAGNKEIASLRSERKVHLAKSNDVTPLIGTNESQSSFHQRRTLIETVAVVSIGSSFQSNNTTGENNI